ncbi:NUDIX domain-containing protein [Xylaria nigripes]|nr:NUDIX domain-containing protein [Xylaria nigripes]
MSAQIARVISTELLENKDARWINLVKISYEDQNGQIRSWEGTRRPTRPKTSPVDAVVILGMRELPTGAEVLLEKQFRAPAGKLVVEFPAGLVDEGETVEEAALRELSEETGYVGEIIHEKAGQRPMFFSCFATLFLTLLSSTTFMIKVKIDANKEENKNPKPQLEDGEFINCFWLPLKDLYDECKRLETQGFAIDGKVGAFAEGLEATKVWRT